MAELTAALENGANPDESARLKIGMALLTGLGAPRSIDDGIDLLRSIAENWSSEAAAMLARALESVGRDGEAYEMALIALAGSDLGALAVADQLEQRLSPMAILSMQDEVISVNKQSCVARLVSSRTRTWTPSTGFDSLLRETYGTREQPKGAHRSRESPKPRNVARVAGLMGRGHSGAAANGSPDRKDAGKSDIRQATFAL